MKTRPIIMALLLSLSLARPGTAGAVDSDVQEPEFVYDDHDNRDPFWPLVNSQGIIINYEKDLLITDMVLEGIFLEDGGRSVAIVNGQVLQVNDAIGPFVVAEIQAERVVLQRGQERFALKLKKEE